MSRIQSCTGCFIMIGCTHCLVLIGVSGTASTATSTSIGAQASTIQVFVRVPDLVLVLVLVAQHLLEQLKQLQLQKIVWWLKLLAL